MLAGLFIICTLTMINNPWRLFTKKIIFTVTTTVNLSLSQSKATSDISAFLNMKPRWQADHADESVCVCVCVCGWVLCVCVCVCVGGRHRVCHFCWQGVAVHFCSSNTEFTNAEVCVIDDYEILQTCHQSPGVSTRRSYVLSVKRMSVAVCVSHLKTGSGHGGQQRLCSGGVGVSSRSWTAGYDVQMRRLRRVNGQLVVACQFWGRHISPRAWQK